MRKMTLREELAAAKSRATRWEEIARDAITQRDTSTDEIWLRMGKAEDFIRHLGYRRCDIPACNCGNWHHHQGD